jgi:hypothetical protein
MRNKIGWFIGIACFIGVFGSTLGYGGIATLGMTPPHLSCGNLSPEEQQFANYLCAPHRSAFCQEFTMQQRREAMQLMYRNNMTPNEAVHEIIVRNRMSTMMGPNSFDARMAQPCRRLGNREYQFAMTLCPSHRQVFCMRFSSSQRKRALKLARKYPLLSSDRAVHIVMEESGMTNNSQYYPHMMMPPSRGMCGPYDGNPYGRCRNW